MIGRLLALAGTCQSDPERAAVIRVIIRVLADSKRVAA